MRRGYLATGYSKCSAFNRRPPSRLSSTSPVGLVHRTCRPSGPKQPLTMVSSTSATCNAQTRSSHRPSGSKQPSHAACEEQRIAGRNRARVPPEAEEAGRRPEAWQLGFLVGRGSAVPPHGSASRASGPKVREDRKKVGASLELSLERKLKALPQLPR